MFVLVFSFWAFGLLTLGVILYIIYYILLLYIILLYIILFSSLPPLLPLFSSFFWSTLLYLPFFSSFPSSILFSSSLPPLPYSPLPSHSKYTCRYLHILIYTILFLLLIYFPPPSQYPSSFLFSSSPPHLPILLSLPFLIPLLLSSQSSVLSPISSSLLLHPNHPS